MPEEQPVITLGLLNAVGENEQVTQRAVAKDLGIALGMVNAYLKRCIKKGYVKVSTAPANRYAYYLTPIGFAEKSRLTAEYLSSSFNFFRNARQQCTDTLAQCQADGYSSAVLVGNGDLAEIVILCSREFDLGLKGVIDPDCPSPEILGLPSFANAKNVDAEDALIITNLLQPQEVYDELLKTHADERIYVPGILAVSRNAPAMVEGAGT